MWWFYWSIYLSYTFLPGLQRKNQTPNQRTLSHRRKFQILSFCKIRCLLRKQWKADFSLTMKKNESWGSKRRWTSTCIIFWRKKELQLALTKISESTSLTLTIQISKVGDIPQWHFLQSLTLTSQIGRVWNQWIDKGNLTGCGIMQSKLEILF